MRKKFIVIVDDSATIRRLIQRELEAQGYEVVAFCDGLEALSALNWMRQPPDLITLDIDMPRMDGFTACEQLRQREKEGLFGGISADPVPVLFISANDTVENRQRGFVLGCMDFLAKPFKREDIVSVVNRILQPVGLFSGLRTLVVDDSKTIRVIVRRCLERIGLDVMEAESVRQAREILTKKKYGVDLVIVDYCMPGEQGDQLVRFIRKHRDSTQLPVLFLSAEGESGHIIQMFRLGANDYIVKPFIAEELLARVQVHLQVRLHLGQLEEMNRCLYDKSIRDGLTGLYNKRYLLEWLEQMFTQSVRGGADLCCLFFDLDFFKQVNDNCGHDFGDYVLREIAGLVRQVLQPGDFAVRYGGEEFIIFLPGVDIAGGVQCGHRLRESVEQYTFSFLEKTWPVTISAGVASLGSDHPSSPTALVAQADSYLYKAKNQGRNRVVSCLTEGGEA
ncbi:MAG: response regulator [Desulfobulbaceae bacterium]|nr:response regulator [Desulfobulbaceae bacterium]